MLTLFFYEVRKEIKSFRFYLIGALFLITAFIIGKFSPSLSLNPNAGGINAISVLITVITFLGFLFSGILFSGIISREIETQRIRYIVPYISRTKIYLSKYIYMVSYFILWIFLSLLLLFILRGELFFPSKQILNVLNFFLFTEAVILLVSTLFSSDKMVSLISLSIGLAFPSLYLATFFKDNAFFKTIKWLLPYHYLDLTFENFFLLLSTLVLIIIGIVIFNRKDV